MPSDIVETLTELAEGFEQLTDTQAMDPSIYIYEWQPPWFVGLWAADGGFVDAFRNKDAEKEFQAKVIDAVFALRKAVEMLGDGLPEQRGEH